MSEYYAYIHARPNTMGVSGVFYVGKGKGRRCHSLINRSAYHQNVINKHGAEKILVGTLDCSSEKIAFDLEKGLIKCLRRVGVQLTNMSDGGEGSSGLVHSPATRQKLSIAITEARKSPALRQRHSEAMKLHYADPEARKVTGNISRKVQNTPEALAKRSLISKRVAKILGSEHYKMMVAKVDKAARDKKMIEVNNRPEKIEKQRISITAVLNDPIFKAAHKLKMKEVGATAEFRNATSIGTKAAVNAPGVQDKRRAYLRAKFAYLKAHSLPRYYRGATKEIVFAWAKENGEKHG